MATYTANYGLHQWVAEDNFQRTDFNEDLQKIDAAIQAVKEGGEAYIAEVEAQVTQAAEAADSKAQKAQDTLEPLLYNVCNLALRHQFDQTLPELPKGMLLDCFPDSGGIAQLSDSVRAAEHMVTLYAKGVGTRTINYGTSYWVTPGTKTDSWVQEGRSQATAVKLRLTGGDNYSRPQLRVTLSGGGQSVSVDYSFSYTSITEVTLTFNSPIILEGGVTYTLSVINMNNINMEVYTSTSGRLGYTLVCTALNVPSGTITAVGRQIGLTASRAIGWVRYSNGTVGLALNNKAMTETGKQTTTQLNGLVCTQSMYRLEQTLSGTVTPKLTLTAGNSSTMTVYDYGIVFLA